MSPFAITPLAALRAGSRHDHMVRRFSHDPLLIARLRTMGVGRTVAHALIVEVVTEMDAPAPDVTFHGGRGPHTGYCRQPRARAVEITSERLVQVWEDERGPWPENGMIRLGDPTSLGTIAHELGHHLVNVFEAPHTAAHGKAWVARFDQAAANIGTIVDVTG